MLSTNTGWLQKDDATPTGWRFLLLVTRPHWLAVAQHDHTASLLNTVTITSNRCHIFEETYWHILYIYGAAVVCWEGVSSCHSARPTQSEFQLIAKVKVTTVPENTVHDKWTVIIHLMISYYQLFLNLTLVSVESEMAAMSSTVSDDCVSCVNSDTNEWKDHVLETNWCYAFISVQMYMCENILIFSQNPSTQRCYSR